MESWDGCRHDRLQRGLNVLGTFELDSEASRIRLSDVLAESG
jgi:hypothetical protein